MLYGGQYSLVIGFGATVWRYCVALIIGAIAAVSRKAGSEIIMCARHHHVVPRHCTCSSLCFILVTAFLQSSLLLALCIRLRLSLSSANIVSEYGEDYVYDHSFLVLVHHGFCGSMFFVTALLQLWSLPLRLLQTQSSLRHPLTFIGQVLQSQPNMGNILAARAGCSCWPLVAGIFPGLAIMMTCLALNIFRGSTDAMAAAPGAL